MSLLGYLVQYRFRDMGELMRNEKKPPQDCVDRLDGKTVALTGATAGIGLATARLFATLGADLILINRDPGKSKALEEELVASGAGKVTTILTDFASLEATKKCAARLLEYPRPIDVLIHNAGVYYTDMELTSDGIETVFQVNHLSSFCLNYTLKEKLKEQNRARILYVNSEGHRFALAGVHTEDLLWRRHRYSGLKSYGAAKTAQLLTMYRFQDYFSDSAVTVNAMHPGNVVTNIGMNNGQKYIDFKKKHVLPSAKDPAVSARALHYLAASEEAGRARAKFFNLTTEERPAPHARDMKAIDKIWAKSVELCGLE